MEYQGYVKAIEYIKSMGISKQDASDYLDFDSDQKPNKKYIEEALNEVYGK